MRKDGRNSLLPQCIVFSPLEIKRPRIQPSGRAADPTTWTFHPSGPAPTWRGGGEAWAPRSTGSAELLTTIWKTAAHASTLRMRPFQFLTLLVLRLEIFSMFSCTPVSRRTCNSVCQLSTLLPLSEALFLFCSANMSSTHSVLDCPHGVAVLVSL